MRMFFCISLLIFSPMFAAQYFARALLIHRLPTSSITAFGQLQNRSISISAICATDDSVKDHDRVYFDNMMTSIATRMRKAGLSKNNWDTTRYDIEKAFCSRPLPLVAAFYSLSHIVRDINGFKHSLPEDYEARRRYFAAKNSVEEALVDLKCDERWLDQYQAYVRGVKEETMRSLDW